MSLGRLQSPGWLSFSTCKTTMTTFKHTESSCDLPKNKSWTTERTVAPHISQPLLCRGMCPLSLLGDHTISWTVDKDLTECLCYGVNLLLYIKSMYTASRRWICTTVMRQNQPEYGDRVRRPICMKGTAPSAPECVPDVSCEGNAGLREDGREERSLHWRLCTAQGTL